MSPGPAIGAPGTMASWARSATRSISSGGPGPTTSAPPSSLGSGRIPTSIPKRPRSTTCVCSKSPRRGIRCSMRSRSRKRRRTSNRRPSRNAPTRRRSGTRRSAAVKGLLRSPLVVFAIAGLVLFVVARAFDGPKVDARDDQAAILVEREALLDYVQLRSGEVDASRLETRWDRLDPSARQVWIDRFVREEALVREARRLGLDQDDDLIRRRLVQQMEFLVAADADEGVDEASLEAAHAERAEMHRVPASVTFSHVFVRDPAALEPGANPEAEGRAQSLREALDEEQVGFDGARDRGDRFLYNRVYVDRTLDEVRSHFG
ncbi:unnamed protein product, partial [Discosporangium mesarthrocarpum]